MPTRDERKREAIEHVGLVRGVFEKENEKAIASARIYEDGKGRDLTLGEPRFDETQVVVQWNKLASVIDSEEEKVCVLDPAHFTRAGGNYLTGAWSIEEQICAESNLFCVLEGLKSSYYHKNRNATHGGLNSDRAVYLKDIVFTTDGGVKSRDVLVVAPVNRRFALENNRSEAECKLDMSHRVETILRIAATHDIDTLILHPFGCGFYDNDPQMVAELFKSWFDEHAGYFKRVVFAIAGGPALDVFREVFPLEDRRYASSDDDEEIPDDTQDEQSTDVKPVSEGRWVFE